MFVEIPKAAPGQRYVAPSNEQQPLYRIVWALFVFAMCASLPGAPGVIFGLILGTDINAREHYLWVWIPMIIFIELIALLVAWGVWREAMGVAGVRGGERGAGVFRRPRAKSKR